MNSLCKALVKSVHGAVITRSYVASIYKSAVSLDTLYPNSNLKLTTPSHPQSESNEKFSGYIPLDELDISYTKSSGPGGQNVNKVNTKVEVRFQIQAAKWISDEIRSKMQEKYKNVTTKEGYVIFRSDITRSQQMNLADCLEKIRRSVWSCEDTTKPPSEETLEKHRRKLEKATRERLAFKRTRSQIKDDRRGPQIDF